MKVIVLVAALFSVFTLARGDCAFIVHEDLKPQPPTEDEKAPQLVEDMTCKEWVGKDGCCNMNSFRQTTSSFLKIDTVFGGAAGGCDVCAVNLKRFWCMYSCSPNQSDFVEVYDYEWVDSFTHPGQKLYVQKIVLYVESSTACKLFKSCQRTSYASQVSAMQTPAGFLSFQGTNAVEDGCQTIDIRFTDDKTKGLYVPDLDTCDLALDGQFRNFTNVTSCSCNSCDAMCSGSDIYTPTPVMQGFDYVFVGSVWGGVLAISIFVTVLRHCCKRRKDKQS